MSTIYDWITVAIFAGLIVLFLHRSNHDEVKDPFWKYLVAAVGCAATNYLGNEEQHLAAIALLLLTVGYIFWALRPLAGDGAR